MQIVKTVYTMISLLCLHCLPAFLFHRTLKTPFYMYLLFDVIIFLSCLLLNICKDSLKTELNYRELYPLA